MGALIAGPLKQTNRHMPAACCREYQALGVTVSDSHQQDSMRLADLFGATSQRLPTRFLACALPELSVSDNPSIALAIRKSIRRRSAIEPAIGHMKNDGKLRRNWL